MTQYYVWLEGYAATGEHAKASLLGVELATTFKEAVEKVLLKRKMMDHNYDPLTLSYWGCRFYDNEEDARKTFG